MAFGKFMGDKRLDAQKAGLAESKAKLDALEAWVRNSDDLYDQFAPVWGDGVPQELTERLGKARELADLLYQRTLMTKRELPNFDEAADLLARDLPQMEERWKAFVAILIAREAIVGEGSAPPMPTNAECQHQLMAMAKERFAAMRTYLDELAEIRPDHEGPWPPALDLPVLEANMADIRGVMDIYIERLAEGAGELPESATCMLFDIVAKLENGITLVEDQRV